MTHVLRFALLAAIFVAACDSGDIALGVGSATDPLEVLIGCDGLPADAITINEGAVSGDRLTLNVSYSGGCGEHRFALCWDGAFLESDPVQAAMTLRHDSGGDTCEAYITHDIDIDLTLLRERYEAAYQTDSGTIALVVKDAPESVVYDW